jgi:heptosyltransferase III
MQKLIALWSHRYRKYTHLLKVYLFFIKVYIEISFLKLRFFGKKTELVAIVLTQQLGDIVAGEPISRQIREKYPNGYILWIVKPFCKELLVNNPNIDKIIEELCANQRKLLINSGVFDKVYNLQFRNNSHCSVCNIYVENPVADSKDITIHNYYFQGNLLTVQQKIAGLPTEDIAPKIYIDNAQIAKVDSLNLPASFVVIHCQSAQNSRNWNSSKWTELVDYLLQNTDTGGVPLGGTPQQIVEIGLESELNIVSHHYTNLCGKLSILETAEVIKRAKLFIGVDSGPAHLANAVGTFGVIMIGKLVDFINHIPYSGAYKSGENAIIVRNSEGPSSEISVETVIQIIVQNKLLLK